MEKLFSDLSTLTCNMEITMMHTYECYEINQDNTSCKLLQHENESTPEPRGIPNNRVGINLSAPG